MSLKCEICQRSFGWASNLNAHTRIINIKKYSWKLEVIVMGTLSDMFLLKGTLNSLKINASKKREIFKYDFYQICHGQMGYSQ